jgi:predicted DCC family thiol-disulfide oxidoreductase YuxK
MNYMSMQSKSQNGEIFYDGLCVLCSREIEHYRKQSGADAFKFIDITDSNFDAAAHGVDPYAVHKNMHVKDANGTLHVGVDAFRAIWKQLPKYNFLYQWTQSQNVQKIMSICYFGFTKVRPYLPRKKANCEQSPYCEINTQKK